MTAPGVFHLARPIPMLLAQSRGARQQVDVGTMLLWLGIATVVIGGISLGMIFAHRAAVQRRKNSHPGLFDALCKVHNLDRGQKSLLQQVVRARNMTFPGQVFTEPKWLNPKSLPGVLQGKATELGNLRRLLFN